MDSKPRDSAAGLTRFPSLAKWEDPWEARVDLRTLRGRAAHFETVKLLANDPHHEGEPPRVDRQDIRDLVEKLALQEAEKHHLAKDAAAACKSAFGHKSSLDAGPELMDENGEWPDLDPDFDPWSA